MLMWLTVAPVAVAGRAADGADLVKRATDLTLSVAPSVKSMTDGLKRAPDLTLSIADLPKCATQLTLSGIQPAKSATDLTLSTTLLVKSGLPQVTGTPRSGRCKAARLARRTNKIVLRMAVSYRLSAFSGRRSAVGCSSVRPGRLLPFAAGTAAPTPRPADRAPPDRGD